MKKWVAAGVLVTASSCAYYYYYIRPSQRLETLMILTEKRMLEVLTKLKSVYKNQFTKHQKLFRSSRRKFSSNSKEYSDLVSEFYTSLPSIFSDSIDEAIKDFNITREIYDNSWRLLRTNDQISEAFEECKIIVATGHHRKELEVETLRDCLEFCKSKIDIEFLNLEALHLTVSVMEDELKASYGFEIEDIERGYNYFLESLNDYDSVFQMIKEARTIKDY
jgi:hypothetical protein